MEPPPQSPSPAPATEPEAIDETEPEAIDEAEPEAIDETEPEAMDGTEPEAMDETTPPLPFPRPHMTEATPAAPVQGPPIPEELAEAAAAGTMPDEERQCRARLEALGAEFEDHEPLHDPSGCRADHPLTLASFGEDVALEPPAILTCAMAEASARFVRDEALPLTRKHFDSELEAVHQVSAYVCRDRAEGGKLSEHAFANALDWGAIELADGTMIPVKSYPRSLPRRAGLMRALRQAACGPFKTVLGPGTDADHADHFHFDLAQRRRGGTYCR